METEVRTDSPRGGLTGTPLILVMALLMIGLVVVFGAAKPFEAADVRPPATYGPVTGEEFGAYMQQRRANGEIDTVEIRRAMSLAELAGDRPVVEAMREMFADVPTQDGDAPAGE